MTTNNFCFYWQSRLIQNGQIRGQWYSDIYSPLVFTARSLDVGLTSAKGKKLECFERIATNIFISTMKD
jgi:hypothetical protein